MKEKIRQDRTLKNLTDVIILLFLVKKGNKRKIDRISRKEDKSWRRKRASYPSKQFDPSPTAASRKLTLTGRKNFTFLKKTGLKKAPFHLVSDFLFPFFLFSECSRIFTRGYFSPDDERERERDLSLPSTVYVS